MGRKIDCILYNHYSLLILGCWSGSPKRFDKCEIGPAPFNRERLMPLIALLLKDILYHQANSSASVVVECGLASHGVIGILALPLSSCVTLGKVF